MVKKFVRDESGIAMGLAVVMIVLIGVMGAGLLVFVRNDLEAVVEVNQGQKAFDIADSGVQVARQQILGDKIPAHYDVDNSSDPNYLNAGCNVDPADPNYGVGESKARTPVGEDWSPEDGGDGVGQTRSFAGGQFTVTIRWLNPDPPVGTPDECKAPELGTPPPGTDYFKVISTGTFGNATRRVEAIYDTYRLNVPRAYYTPGKITISGSACIEDVSLFSSDDSADGTAAIDFNGTGTCPATGTHIQGTDLYYGDWDNPPFNTTPRLDASGNPITDAGVGAVGQVSDSPRLGTRDYDGPDADSDGPEFVRVPSTDPQPSSEITFPFNADDQLDANHLCDEAKAQGNYITDSSTGLVNLNAWPNDSSENTVVCYVFTNPASNNELRWSVSGDTSITSGDYSGCKEPRKKGTLVVRGGGFTVKPKTALFEGVVVVRGPVDQESEISNTDEAGLSGNTCLDGFVNSTGPIKITGTVSPSGSAEVNSRPGFFGVQQWSWRELYQ